MSKKMVYQGVLLIRMSHQLFDSNCSRNRNRHRERDRDPDRKYIFGYGYDYDYGHGHGHGVAVMIILIDDTPLNKFQLIARPNYS